MAGLSLLRDLLAEKDNQLSNLVDQFNDRNHRLTGQDKQLAEQDERLAGLVKLIQILQDEVRLLKKLPRRPDLKPSGQAASMQGKPAAGSSSGSERSK